MKIADALLRRRELQIKVEQLERIKEADLFEYKFERCQVNDQLDDIKARVPKLDIRQVTEEFDYYANKLRLIDAAIQQANWTTDIEVDPKVWKNYSEN